MRLDRRHLVGALALLAGSIVYNVWALATPDAAGGPTGAAVAATASAPAVPVPGEDASPRTPSAEPAADVMLDSPPEWPRDPFRGAAAPSSADPGGPAEPPPTAPVAAPAADPELVLTSVLYSSARKLAMVNGRTVGPGETVDGVTVVEIRPSAIVVQFPSGSVRTIERLTPGSQRRRP